MLLNANSANPELIDGQQLTHLMLEHGLGVTTVQTYEIKQVDRDYFDES